MPVGQATIPLGQERENTPPELERIILRCLRKDPARRFQSMDDLKVALEELKAFLSGKLGKHEIPAAVDFVEELPRTSVGKLSRHELRLQQPAQTKQQVASGGRA